jgi:MraZ protein
MLIGEYTHKLDPKKRLSFPVKFRKELGKKVVITHGLDTCLFVYSAKEWGAIAGKIAELGIGQADRRGFNRFMLAGAQEVEVDSLGRILIPDFLKTFAGLRENVVLAGVYNRVEIWNDTKWQTYKKKIQGQADALAEKLGDIGAL